MRWRLCISDGMNGYTVYVHTKGDSYPSPDYYQFYKAKLDDGTPCMVNKEYVVIMFRDDEEAEE